MVVTGDHPDWGPTASVRPVRDLQTMGGVIREDATGALRYIREAEDSIASDSFETAFLITDDGDQILKKVGTANSVGFTDADILAIENAPSPVTLAHNHPSGSSFSMEDLSMGVTTNNLDTIRATTVDRTFQFKIKVHGTELDDDLIDFFEEQGKSIHKTLRGQVQQHIITPDQAQLLHTHIQWRRTADQFPQYFDYEVFGAALPDSLREYRQDRAQWISKLFVEEK